MNNKVGSDPDIIVLSGVKAGHDIPLPQASKQLSQDAFILVLLQQTQLYLGLQQ